MFIVIGLGNPGLKYKNTKHNIGFICIENIAKKLNIKIDKIKFKALIGEGHYKGEKIILVKPQTFMNLSGECVQEIMNFYKITHENLYIIYDDIDIEMGKLRIRKKGSAGTHNGMRDIIYRLGYDDFPRFRVGMKGINNKMDLKDYVLSKFTDNEAELLSPIVEKVSLSILDAIENGIDFSMNKYNTR